MRAKDKFSRYFNTRLSEFHLQTKYSTIVGNGSTYFALKDHPWWAFHGQNGLLASTHDVLKDQCLLQPVASHSWFLSASIERPMYIQSNFCLLQTLASRSWLVSRKTFGP